MTGLLDDDDLLDLRRRADRTDPRAVLEEMKDRREELPDQNSELEAWTEDQAAPASTVTEDAVCAVCRNRPGRHVCGRCGAAVCSADHWIMFGLCRNCATRERVERWHEEHRPEGINWLADKDE